MRKKDNDWEISCLECKDVISRSVEINGTEYEVDEKTAAICHAILLLVDAVNDKGENA